MKSIHFDILGMTCASCQSHVTKAVEKLEGTANVHVNLLTNDMTVDIDDRKVDVQDIVKAIGDAGYGATYTDEGKINKYRMKNKVQESNEKNIKKLKFRLIISLIWWIPLMYLSMHHMFYMWFGLPVPEFIKANFHGTVNAFKMIIAQFILLIPIVVVNKGYFTKGFKSLFKLSPNMDSLIALGATASIIYGIVAGVFIERGIAIADYNLVESYSQQIYIESAGTILTLITVGKFLESKSKGKTGDAISKLIDLAPKNAIVIRNNKEQIIPSEEIEIDDIIIIKPGTSVPVDGVVVEGRSSIDQSAITGESIPIEKIVSDEVISGTINKSGTIKMRATKVGRDTTLAKIIKLVEEASTSKAPIENIADKIASWFVPIVIFICIITLIGWLIAGEGINMALTMAISVLVISCPCALGLATPVAIMVGTGKGAENGILIKSAESLQKMDSVKVVIFDKTGTITNGKPIVTDVITDMNENKFLSIVYCIEHLSEHPLADAIARYTEEKLNINEAAVSENFEAITGKGVTATVEGVKYFLGNIRLIEEQGIHMENNYKEEADKLSSKGKTVMYFADSDNVLGIIAVFDKVSDFSKKAIEELTKKKIKTVMITGDNKLVADEIAREVGINEVYSEVLPDEKEQLVEKIQKELIQEKYVAFVGDGINDSPALARADIGLAIGSGADIAIESADIVLVRNNLLDVVTAIDLSKKTMINIKENLFWAFFYNAVCIPIACGLLYVPFGIKLNPMLGSVAMSLSSVCVVANALRLRLFKNKYYEKDYKDNKKIKEDFIMKKEIIIEGMMCENCSRHVTNALKSIEGVENVEVNLEAKKATLDLSKEVDNEVLTKAIVEEGYKVVDII